MTWTARGNRLRAAATLAVLAALVLAGTKPAQAALPDVAFPNGHDPIAFEVDGDIWVASKMHLANLTPGTPRSDETDPNVLSNGREVVFLSDQDGNPELYAANVFTGEVALVTGSVGHDRAPSLSSGGDSINHSPPRSSEVEEALARRALKESR